MITRWWAVLVCWCVGHRWGGWDELSEMLAIGKRYRICERCYHIELAE